MQWVYEDHQTQRLGGSEEWIEPCVPKGGPCDVGSNFDAKKTQCSDLFKALGCQFGILHWHHADAPKMGRGQPDHRGDMLVHNLAKVVGFFGWEPVRQQFRHWREYLTRDAVLVHV